MRQLALALHHYGSSHNGKLPLIPVNEQVGNVAHPVKRFPSLFIRLLPYLEQAAAAREARKKNGTAIPIPIFISSSDPTAQKGIAEGQGISSYAANAMIFKTNPRLPETFQDGTSNTIVFAEHYAYECGGYSFYYWYNDISSVLIHRATFAEEDNCPPNGTYPDPTIKPNPNVPSLEQLTFQVAPAIKKCNPGIAQTPHSSGMLVALGDGSVRTLAPGMSAATYWGAVTPAGGEVPGPDW